MCVCVCVSVCGVWVRVCACVLGTNWQHLRSYLRDFERSIYIARADIKVKTAVFLFSLFLIDS